MSLKLSVEHSHLLVLKLMCSLIFIHICFLVKVISILDIDDGWSRLSSVKKGNSLRVFSLTLMCFAFYSVFTR